MNEILGIRKVWVANDPFSSVAEIAEKLDMDEPFRGEFFGDIAAIYEFHGELAKNHSVYFMQWNDGQRDPFTMILGNASFSSHSLGEAIAEFTPLVIDFMGVANLADMDAVDDAVHAIESAADDADMMLEVIEDSNFGHGDCIAAAAVGRNLTKSETDIVAQLIWSRYQRAIGRG